MELELKHIAGYLPYKINVKITEPPFKGEIHKLTGINYDGLASLGNGGMFGFIQRSFNLFKPILRPLSDLTKEIEVNGKKFVPEEYLNNNWEKYYLPENWNAVLFIQTENIFSVNYAIIQKLCEWHFDIHDLIGKGLAIDINTLK